MGLDRQLIAAGTYFVVELARLVVGCGGAEGFTTLELMSTLSGEPLYRAAGFEPVERVVESAAGPPCR